RTSPATVTSQVSWACADHCGRSESLAGLVHRLQRGLYRLHVELGNTGHQLLALVTELLVGWVGQRRRLRQAGHRLQTARGGVLETDLLRIEVFVECSRIFAGGRDITSGAQVRAAAGEEAAGEDPRHQADDHTDGTGQQPCSAAGGPLPL